MVLMSFALGDISPVLPNFLLGRVFADNMKTVSSPARTISIIITIANAEKEYDLPLILIIPMCQYRVRHFPRL